ncbi:transglycosylase SLT domain-containing protein [Blastococcus sp. CCUG 61487]|uniref:aggregation-promoting factor C-terminal-like domain-containing protein n=1 Tax=Blastococcus sp. CCUG 61487 TaxID=1840703 RepID=UPI0010BF9FF8|nr:transglycosylase SLT domain-containing protein [Blastococcus sp. CCUG 61487]TKJ32850.1 hypothetical protein A6V29_16590 [Blastococcus sp. CCUG 61487]
MNLRTTVLSRARRSSTGARRPALLVGAAAAGALTLGVLTAAGEPATAGAEAATEPVSVAQQLGITADTPAALEAATVAPLQELAASRSARDAEQQQAALAQLAAEQAEHDRRAAEEAARIAAEEAARAEAARVAQAEEAARRAAAAPRAAAAAPAAPKGSYQSYALQKLGGDSQQFSCLEKLWGKESGWNPNAQNPTSTAYGIPQFLNSTWASTGIAKTSDGYRQIDAGLIYIANRFGTPCGAWSHSQAKGWY